jgi:hypothetical protein
VLGTILLQRNPKIKQPTENVEKMFCMHFLLVRVEIVVYRPEDGSWSIIESYSCKSKITYFELAISICQNIFGF